MDMWLHNVGGRCGGWLYKRGTIYNAVYLLTFNSLYGSEYISAMLIPRTIHCGLSSRDDLTVVVPRTKRKTGRLGI